MLKALLLSSYLLTFLSVYPQQLEAQVNFPLELSTDNTQIEYQIDSTWHLVTWAVNQVSGRAIILPGNENTMQISVNIPVDSLDSDNKYRDRRMREVIKSEEFPAIKAFLVAKLDQCDLNSLLIDSNCLITISGQLYIAGITRKISFPAKVTRISNDKLISTASLSLLWSDYDIEDPSIWVAKLDETVNITLKVKIPYGSN